MVQWKLWQCFRGIQLNEQPSGLGSLRAWQWNLGAAPLKLLVQGGWFIIGCCHLSVKVPNDKGGLAASSKKSMRTGE